MMGNRIITGLIAALAVLTSAAGGRAAEADGRQIDFVEDVRPILRSNCYRCHGPYKQEAGFRWDRRGSARSATVSGHRLIVPGKPADSLLVQAVRGETEPRMPKGEDPLSEQQIETLEAWIAQGATWPEGADPEEPDPSYWHWSFKKPTRPELPEVEHTGWARNPIDRFTLAKMEANGLAPSEPADKHTLIRRLALDLTGLPPTQQQVERFVNDDSPDAYRRLVDRLLNSPRYGERWAQVWLDLARYADSQGYEKDKPRTIWRYRDWVIEALNKDKPYDQFTIEQMAGDLLEDPTLKQKIATAFHRNTMTNTEGGTSDEEFRVAAVKDRAETTMQVWMGLTMQCAKCHDHKFDPVTMKEYYQFLDFFNQTADSDKANERPKIETPTDAQRRKLDRIDERIAAARRELRSAAARRTEARKQWERKLREESVDPVRGRTVKIDLPGQKQYLSIAEVQVFSGGENIAPKGQASQSSTAYGGVAKRAIDGETNGNYDQSGSVTHTGQDKGPWWKVKLPEPAAIDRIVVWNRTDHRPDRLSNFRVTVLNADGEAVWQRRVENQPKPKRALTTTPAPQDVLKIVQTPAGKRTEQQAQRLAEYYAEVARELKPKRQAVAKLKQRRAEVREGVPTTPVMKRLPKDKLRQTHVMKKGNYQSKGEPVEAAVPDAFGPMDEDLPRNRLGVAKWLVSRDNPLTARVAVNRYWSRFFGKGLVKTQGDFGTQGTDPTHPKLLDWLAVEFMDQGWSMKQLCRTIVLSATYRQSSHQRPNIEQNDPQNRLLAKGPRFRLPAETIRDQALAIGGLLTDRIGGPPVMPPQPDGLWNTVYSGGLKWKTDTGADRYRRGVYIFLRRTTPYPSMTTFDAPSREVCTIRRVRTNTPLQSLVTLNDPAFVEAAQGLARRTIEEGGGSVREKVRYAFRRALVRPPKQQEVDRLAALHQQQLRAYQRRPSDAKALATKPLGPLPDGVEPANAAAWTVVANVILNLDELLMKG